MSATITGLPNVQKNIDNYTRKTLKKIKESVDDAAFDLLAKSVDLAPVDTGDLRGSAKVEMKNYTATISYNTKYALRQHENLNYRHNRGGQAKYLEEPFKRNEKKYINMIQKAMEV